MGTIVKQWLCGCILATDSELKKKGRGSYDVLHEHKSGIKIVKWYDNKSVLLTSSHQDVTPVDKCHCWCKTTKEYIEIWLAKPHKLVQQSHGWRGPIWHAYVSLPYQHPSQKVVHSYLVLSYWPGHCKCLITVSSAYEPTKVMPLVEFCAEMGDSLIKAGKPRRVRKWGHPSLEQDDQAQPRLFAVPAPPKAVRFDGVNHLPGFAEKRGRCRLCGDGYTELACLKCNILLCLKRIWTVSGIIIRDKWHLTTYSWSMCHSS